jgi:hypothetical protein
VLKQKFYYVNFKFTALVITNINLFSQPIPSLQIFYSIIITT